MYLQSKSGRSGLYVSTIKIWPRCPRQEELGIRQARLKAAGLDVPTPPRSVDDSGDDSDSKAAVKGAARSFKVA